MGVGIVFVVGAAVAILVVKITTGTSDCLAGMEKIHTLAAVGMRGIMLVE